MTGSKARLPHGAGLPCFEAIPQGLRVKEAGTLYRLPVGVEIGRWKAHTRNATGGCVVLELREPAARTL